MKHWKITDPGLVRRENQDAFGFAQLSGGYTVAVVCDGMGGVAGGSIASSVAVETYIRTLSDSGHPDQAVRAAVMAANSAIRQRAAGHPELRSMALRWYLPWSREIGYSSAMWATAGLSGRSSGPAADQPGPFPGRGLGGKG